MPFVFSPSNMDTYRRCPRRFEGQSITCQIKWKANKAKSRGTLVHNALELAITEGIDKMPPVEGVDTGFVMQKLHEVDQLKQSCGIGVLIEHELVVNDKFAKAGWWDADAYIRAKADAIIMPDDPSMTPLIVDFKTGKKWDTDAFQLRIEALLVHLLYGREKVGYSYWYVDTGETVGDVIDFGGGLAGVSDIIDQLAEMQRAIKASHFPARRNRFCKWCDFYRTPLCTL